MPTISLDPVAPPSCFAANMAILARRCPRLAERLMRTPAREDIVLAPAENPAVLSGELAGMALASRRRPLEEADRLVAGFDVRKSGGLLVLGFGLGYHVAASCRRLKRAGVVVVFEPDLGLLRVALERIDHSSWMAQFPFLIIDDPDDAGAMSEAIRGYEAPLAVGIEVLEHPASRQRLGVSAGRFTESFTRVVSAMRTHVITTMVQTDVTLRNVLMNADAYVSTPGVDALANAANGSPAIVVSAGPSLARTIEALKTPGLRDRCVIVAVQTVLKQLLAAGIRPHYVTALDYHEISRRFYEGLTAQDVEGVTLIAEPRANPAIIEAWPGAMRMTGDKWLEDMLGPSVAGAHATLKSGATVAHLAYYLARHLGCDPVILTGQDLAFTDGQYYAAGAAIHQVWSGELSMFNSLEMMEWQRIIRMRSNLHRAQDHLGRPVYTDDQMATYLAQFERDFGADAQLGLRTIDATEGGVRKAHTTTMTMRDAIGTFAARPAAFQPPPGARTRLDPDRVRRAVDRMGEVRTDIRRIGRLSRETLELLRKMKQHHGDEARVNRIIKDVHKLRDQVQSMPLAFELVQRLNQTGSFKRYRADREILLAEGLSPLERQHRQIDRDITNVQWIVDVCDVFDDLLSAAADACAGKAPRRTRDVAPRELEADSGAGSPGSPVRVSVAAMLAVPAEMLHQEFLGESVVRRTLQRLSQCRSLDRVILITDAPDGVRPLAEGLNAQIVRDDLGEWRARRERTMAARRWSGAAWRGGIAHLTCYDEALDPASLRRWLAEANADAALVLGADWCLVDPQLCDQIIVRHRETPEAQPLVFTQAPPGLAGCVVARSLVEELAKGQAENVPFASIGGLLGYIPTNARADPIVKPCCVGVDPGVRDAGVRFVPDDRWTREQLERALASAPQTADAAELARICGVNAAARPASPRHVAFEVSAGCDPSRIRTAIDTMRATGRPAPLVTLLDADNSFQGAHWDALTTDLHALGCAIHIRTRLLAGDSDARRVAAWPIDVLSVDVLANSAATYQRVHGIDAFQRVIGGLEVLLKGRDALAGLPATWVVPRITRCDAVYEEIEGFYDVWLMLGAAAAIDPLSQAHPGDRIAPLARPAHIVRRSASENLLIRADGNVWADERQQSGPPVGNAWNDGIVKVWSALSAWPERWTGW